MLQNSFKNVVLSAAVVCLSSGVARESKADVASCASPIPLGLTTALTGNLALLGIQARNGVEFAVDEINASGGIAGKKLVLTTEDTGASSTDALNAMNRIIESKPLIIFGSMIARMFSHRPKASTNRRRRFLSAPPTPRSRGKAASGCSGPMSMTASWLISFPNIW